MKHTLQRRSVRIARSRRIGLYLVGSGVWLSGVLWLIFHNFFASKGDLGPEANPLEPWSLKIHGAFAFAAIWIFGLLWGIHVKAAWPYGKKRWSGVFLVVAFLLLTFTGYLLYYLGGEAARNIVSVAHWVIGLGAPLALLWHRWRYRRKSVPQPRPLSQSQSA